MEDEHAIFARLRLRHEAEVVHVEASRARLIGDGESKMVHLRMPSTPADYEPLVQPARLKLALLDFTLATDDGAVRRIL